MPTPDDLDPEVQVEPPQQTIRAEAPDSSRQNRDLTYGEMRVFVHAATALTQKQIDVADAVTDSIRRLKATQTQADKFLLTRSLSETGTWQADQRAYVTHHRKGTIGEGHDAGEDADATLLSRLPRLKPWMYWSLQVVLVAADFMFFLSLWRDVEEATSWFSVQTVQSVIYALITPVTVQTVAYGLGRAVATWLRRRDTMPRADRGLLTVLSVAGVVAVLTVVFGVMQRLTMHASVEGAVPVNPVLFYALFLILPLALGLAEVLRHDEAVALAVLRCAANSAADEHLNAIIDAGTGHYDAWVDAYEDVVQLRDVLRLQMQEPLFAAADLIAQERAHHGHDGAYAHLLWSGTAGPHTGVDWVDIGLPTGAFDPVIDGPAPRVNLDRVQRLDAALAAHTPPSARHWMSRIENVLRPEATGESPGSAQNTAEGIDDSDWDELTDTFGDVLADNDPQADNR